MDIKITCCVIGAVSGAIGGLAALAVAKAVVERPVNPKYAEAHPGTVGWKNLGAAIRTDEEVADAFENGYITVTKDEALETAELTRPYRFEPDGFSVKDVRDGSTETEPDIIRISDEAFMKAAKSGEEVHAMTFFKEGILAGIDDDLTIIEDPVMADAITRELARDEGLDTLYVSDRRNGRSYDVTVSDESFNNAYSEWRASGGLSSESRTPYTY